MKHPGPLTGVPLIPARAARGTFVAAGAATVGLALLAAAYVAAIRPDTLAADYFFGQDLPLLLAAGTTLVGIAPLADRGGPLRPLHGWQAALAVALAALVAQIGCGLVFERFGASRDEQIAEFMATYLQHGTPGVPIPPGLSRLRSAMLPLYADVRGGRWWVGSYYPVNAAFRALVGWLSGDRWLAGPILLAIGLAGLWHAARALWPGRPEARTVALLLGVGSAQLLATAMTPYAMTAQFAVEAWWIAAVVRPTPRGQLAAAVLGLVATGVHQAHFHPQFASGFVAWLWLSGRRRDALAQAVAIVLAWAFWDQVYTHALLDRLLGPGLGDTSAGARAGYLARLLEVDPIPSLARFVAWQNILLAPLALVGARAALRDGSRPATWGMAVSCAIGLLVTVDGVHGLGCRYLAGLIPCFCLLATDGWFRLEERRGRPLGGSLLWAATVVTILVSVPFALWRSHAATHPYAAAYRLVRAAPADTVLVDPRGAAFAQDIVRFEDPAQRPLLLDLAKVPMASLAGLCRGRVMILDHRQTGPLGIAGRTTQSDAGAAAARRAWLARAGCGRPITGLVPSG